MRYKLDDYVQELVRGLSVVDWWEKLSKKSQIEEESFNRRLINQDAFNIIRMVERVKKEQVEHKLEYCRGVLSHAISNLSFSEILGMPKTWEGLVADNNMCVKMLKKDIKDLINFREGRYVAEDSSVVGNYKDHVERFRSSGYEPLSLDKWIEDRRLGMDVKIFVRRLLDQEKNWVEKVLRS